MTSLTSRFLIVINNPSSTLLFDLSQASSSPLSLSFSSSESPYTSGTLLKSRFCNCAAIARVWCANYVTNARELSAVARHFIEGKPWNRHHVVCWCFFWLYCCSCHTGRRLKIPDNSHFRSFVVISFSEGNLVHKSLNVGRFPYIQVDWPTRSKSFRQHSNCCT